MPQDAIRSALGAVLAELGGSPTEIRLERPRDSQHGDLSTNLALAVAKELGRPPREVAQEIARRLDLKAAGVDAVEVAGPGFLNFRLSHEAVASVLDEILQGDASFGKSDVGGGKGGSDCEATAIIVFP